MPHWPVNDSPNPASVAWDSSGLRISASNSSLQQILNEVSIDTGTKVVGSIPDQRVYGEYGPGDARDVLSQLLLGSGFNVLLAGDIGKGAPSEIVLTPRRTGSGNAANAMNHDQQQVDQDDDVSEQPEEEPPPQLQQPQMPAEIRPAPGPNGPMRTPQQVMEEMQQRQLLQQQQMQQQIQQQQQMQQQQQNPQQ